MITTALNRGSNTEDIGKLWLALDSLGRAPDRERFFKRCNRPTEDLPQVAFVPLPSR